VESQTSLEHLTIDAVYCEDDEDRYYKGIGKTYNHVDHKESQSRI
jgi:hypothetical protein